MKNKLISTSIPNLLKYIDTNSEITYYARFRRNNKEHKCKLANDFDEARKLLITIKQDEKLGISIVDSFKKIKIVNKEKKVFTYNDLFKEYIHVYLPIHSAKEIKTKRYYFKNHIMNRIGSLPISKIIHANCQIIINDVLSKGLKPKTAKNIKANMQAVFNYAIINQYITYNPAQLVLIPAFDNKVDLQLTTKECKDLVHTILTLDNQMYRLIFLFALHGRRLSEILKMQWYQIDFIKELYTLPAQKNKAKKTQSHSFTNLLENELLNYHEKILNKDSYLFINKNTNKPFVDISKTFKRLKENAELENKFRFHDFRHLLATIGLNNCDISIEKISHALGHSSIAVTESRYVTKKAITSKDVVTSVLKELNKRDL